MSAKKIAFVVGINSYDNLGAERQLLRAVNDARAVSKSFESLGFEVVKVEEATRGTFNEKWQTFLDRIETGDTVAFYFSGHGMEIEGLNFLLPRDVPYVNFGRQERIKRESISVSELLLDLRKREPQVTLVILDACRDHPFIPPEFRTVGPHAGGLARMDAPEGTFIMYAAGAGQTALDRLPGSDPDQENSVYTRALLPLLVAPGLGLPELARRLRLDVHAAAANSGHSQTPAYYDGLIGRFCLAGCADDLTRTVMSPQQSSRAGTEYDATETLAWGKAVGADRLDGYRNYLSAWPTSRFAVQAEARIVELEGLSQRWHDLKKSKSLIDLRTFADEANSSEFGLPAVTLLKELTTAEAAAWAKAEDVGSLSTYEKFLREWPSGLLESKAREKLVELRSIKADWEKIRTTSDEQSLESFAFRHGWTEYGVEATAQLVALRRERIKPDSGAITTLSAEEMLRVIDGRTVSLKKSRETLRFDTKGMPSYRPRLGKDFLKQVVTDGLSAEGSFKTDQADSQRSSKLEGLGAIVKSKVDGIGSLFLLQMHGNERDRKDVDRTDRRFKTLQIVRDAFGYVCISTGWHPILSEKKPMKAAERCTIGVE